MNNLEEILGHKPTELELAGHFADLISAQEQLQRIARLENDLELLNQSTAQIMSIRFDAREADLDPSKYRMIFRSG